MFPLSAFLQTLESDGIRLAVQDYDRIARVLGCEGHWTLARLRDVLLALVARDVNQRDVVGRRFDGFFDNRLEPLDVGAVDMAEIRAELRHFRERRTAPLKTIPRPTPPPIRPLLPPAPDPRRWQRVALALTLMGVIVGAVIAGWLMAAPPVPQLEVAPPAHVMTAIPQASETVQFTITNTGDGELVVHAPSLHVPRPAPDDTVFTIERHTCKNALHKGEQCLVQVKFQPGVEDTYQAALRVKSSAGDFSAELTGHCRAAVETVSGEVTDPDDLPPVVIPAREMRIQIVAGPALAGSHTWRRAAALAGLFAVLTLVFGWYLYQSRQPPVDPAPAWDTDKPRHFPAETVGGAPAPLLDAETLGHLADSMGYFRSHRAGRRPDIDASVRATVKKGGMPQLVFQEGRKLRHLIILVDGLAGEAANLNPIADQLRDGMRRRGVALIHGRFFGDPAVFHADDGGTLYLDDLEASRRAFLLLIFSAGVRSGVGHTLERLARWPHVAWFDLRIREHWDGSAGLPTRYGIPCYPATAAGLCQAFARFLTEAAPQTEVAAMAAGQPPPPSWDTPLDVCLETLLGEALPWAQACAMIQPVGPGMADGLRRAFYAHLAPEVLQRLAHLPGTTRDAAGFRFSDAVLAELRRGFVCRHPAEAVPASECAGSPSQEAVLRFILSELESAWRRAVGANPALQASPAHLAWEKQFRCVQLELDPDAALPRLAALAGTPLENAIRAALDKAVLPEDDGRSGEPAGIPLRRAPVQPDNRQRLARLARKSGLTLLDKYPLRWWQWGVAALLVLGLFCSAGWSIRAYGRLRPTIEVAGEPDMRVQAAIQGWQDNAWGEILPRAGLPIRIENVDATRLRLAVYRYDEPDSYDHVDLGNTRASVAVQLSSVETKESDGEVGYLVATDDKGRALMQHMVTVRGALFRQTVPANQTLNLAPGRWQARVETAADENGNASESASVFGSAWQTVTVTAGQKEMVPFGSPAYFRDRMKGGGWGPEMAPIPAGSFTMGSPADEAGRGADEGPQHPVTLAAFALGRFEVTFAEYDAFCEATGREKPDDNGWGRGNRPVVNVTWEDAQAYAAWLSDQTGRPYRLPSEAEWEYAARAGSQTAFYWGKTIDVICGHANLHDMTSQVLNKFDWDAATCNDGFGWTAPVGMFKPNGYGLYDMAGNVWEWVSDWYGAYAKSTVENPKGPEDGVVRVFRGGGWFSDQAFLRSTVRNRDDSAYRSVDVGFRIARNGPLPSIPLTLGRPAPATKPLITITGSRRYKPVHTRYVPFKSYTDRLQDGTTGPEMVFIPGGTFQMGSPETEPGHDKDESPVHPVTVGDFLIGRFEVTVGEFKRFVDAVRFVSEAERGKGCYSVKSYNFEELNWRGDSMVDDQTLPVACVSWNDATAYAQWLRQQTGKRYRLPTEAEWEYAARAGNQTAYSFGDNPKKLNDYAWYDNNSGKRVHPFGKKGPNPWGLYDLHGNLREWVKDWYGVDYYSKSSVQNPQGPSAGADRGLRGGSWDDTAEYCRSASRFRLHPSSCYDGVGFRLVLLPGQLSKPVE